MRNIILNQKITAGIASAVVLVIPLLANSQVGIPCGDFTAGQKECGFNDLIILANNIIKFLMFSVAVPLAAIGFMYTGGRLIVMQSKESEWEKAKTGFADIAMGFGIMLGAYVFIKTILFAFLTQEQPSFMQFLFQ